MDFKLSKADPLEVKCDVLVFGKFENERIGGLIKGADKALENVLERTFEQEKFKGEMGKSVMINTLGKIQADRILIVGLGKRSKFSLDVLRKVGIHTAKMTCSLSQKTAFALEVAEKRGNFAALSEGMMLGLYNFNKYKTNEKGSEGDRIVEFVTDKLREKMFSGEVEYAKTIAEATNFARDLVNEPPLALTPGRLAEIAAEIAKDGKLGCKILDTKEIEKRGMGGLMAVSKGSDEPPRFIHLTFDPTRAPRKTVAIVGKGITFDSGGLCIKPSDSMRTMKMDMSGAACVLGVMKALPKLNPHVRVHGLISATENMPGGKAYKPDDIIRALDGKTIEVVNTDAEGRIVLADALCYAVQLGIKEIVDLATLTGACMVGLGNYTAGLMGNDQSLINRILAAADLAGEKVWQLPLDEELRKEIDSDVADVKNVGSRWGGAITAAMFLEKFVGDTAWAHIDIAGPAYVEKGGDWYPKGGTGFGVRTVIRYLLGR